MRTKVQEKKGKTGAAGLCGSIRFLGPYGELLWIASWSYGHAQEFQSSMKIMESREKTFSSEFDKCGLCGQGKETLVHNYWSKRSTVNTLIKCIICLMKQPDACGSCGGRPKPNHGLKLTSPYMN